MNIKSKSTLEKMEKIMRVRNYSNKTIETYIIYVGNFLNDFDKDPYHIPIKDAITTVNLILYSIRYGTITHSLFMRTLNYLNS